MSQETEWFEGRNQDEPPNRWRVIVECVLGILIGIALAGAMRSAYATPLFSATSEGAVITLTDEPCAVKEIGNLPFRATWVDKDKTYEGCWGAHREIGMVLAYFDDRTIAVIPISVFARVTGA